MGASDLLRLATRKTAGVMMLAAKALAEEWRRYGGTGERSDLGDPTWEIRLGRGGDQCRLGGGLSPEVGDSKVAK